MHCDEDCRTAVFGKTERTVGWEGNGEPVMIGLVRNCTMGNLQRTDRSGLPPLNHSFTLVCNIYVKSKRAGERVLESITRLLSRKLKLTVNQDKSAVDRPWRRHFLGITFSYRGGIRTKVSEKAEKRCKQEIRRLTRRTRGESLQQVIVDLRKYLLGWKAYYGICQVKRPFVELDKWIRRRLRCYAWKQWGRSGYRQLRKLEIDVRLAWNTAKSAHGPWRLSRSPALNYGMPAAYFAGLGLPSLADGER